MITKRCSKIVYGNNDTYKKCRHLDTLYKLDSDHFYIQSLENNNVIDISTTTTWLGSNASKVEYSLSTDSSQSWQSLSGVTSITLNKYNKLYLRSSQGIGKTSLSDLPLITSTKIFRVGGTLTPIVNKISSYSLNNFFIGTKIKSLSLAVTTVTNVASNYSFYRMFKNCTSLETFVFYYNTFDLDLNGNQIIINTFSPGDYCFSEMFYGCTSLNSSTTTQYNYTVFTSVGIKTHVCDSMFYGCTNMVVPPIMYLTGGNTADYAFYRTFYNCKKLLGTGGAYLGALGSGNTIGNYSYSETFYNCTSITVDGLLNPKNDGDNLAVEQIYLLSGGSYGYYRMFYGCTSLENANFVKGGGSVGAHGCDSMFYGCTALTSASIALPKLNTSGYQYASMFMNCTSLVTPPSLASQPDFTNYCCYRMFRGCTSLVRMTKISGTQVYSYGFREMFYGCSKLNYIWCYVSPFTTNGLLPEASNGTTNWVYGVASSGNFYYANNRGIYSWNRLSGANTIPSGWSVHAVE